MVSKPECACGDISALAGGKKRIIFPCAGTANVGLISNTAALQLADEGYGVATCIALLGSGDPGLKSRIARADEVVIIDGCPATCGAKIADIQGVIPAQHILITALGIDKVYERNYTEEEVERVVFAAWEGKGRPEAGTSAR
jgi:uncharacterized metal-binding protein